MPEARLQHASRSLLPVTGRPQAHSREPLAGTLFHLPGWRAVGLGSEGKDSLASHYRQTHYKDEHWHQIRRVTGMLDGAVKSSRWRKIARP